MSSRDVVLIDYGLGNMLSVRRGLERCGGCVTVSGDPAVIRAAVRVVLPGVGAFADGMAGLRRHGLDDVVREVAARGAPLLGICLGMQMLLDESEEFGRSAGLGLIPGGIIPIPRSDPDGTPVKIPHIGWNSLIPAEGRANWRGTPLEPIKTGEAAYFVHSFMAAPTDPNHRIADCQYGGVRVSAAVGRDNIFGCQFHPEKSGEAGLKILGAFLRL